MTSPFEMEDISSKPTPMLFPKKKKFIRRSETIPDGGFSPKVGFEIYDYEKDILKKKEYILGGIDISESGEYFTFTGHQIGKKGGVVLMDSEGNLKWKKVFPGFGSSEYIIISKTGKYVAHFLDYPGAKPGGKLAVIDSAGNITIDYNTDRGGPVRLSFSDDENYLLFSKRNHVLLFDVAISKLLWENKIVPFKEYQIDLPDNYRKKYFFLINKVKCGGSNENDIIQYTYGKRSENDYFKWEKQGKLPRYVIVYDKKGNIIKEYEEFDEIYEIN